MFIVGIIIVFAMVKAIQFLSYNIISPITRTINDLDFYRKQDIYYKKANLDLQKMADFLSNYNIKMCFSYSYVAGGLIAFEWNPRPNTNYRYYGHIYYQEHSMYGLVSCIPFLEVHLKKFLEHENYLIARSDSPELIDDNYFKNMTALLKEKIKTWETDMSVVDKFVLDEKKENSRKKLIETKFYDTVATKYADTKRGKILTYLAKIYLLTI